MVPVETSETTRQVLIGAAFSVALLHTFIGIDHYLPFVVLGRARNWSLKKVAAITALCGVGHVVGSIVLGFVGIALGTALATMEWVESVRGALAAWGLIAFGLMYASWSLYRVWKKKTHAHVHAHEDGSVHLHAHNHEDEHFHVHVPAPSSSSDEQKAATLTFWSVFIVFALGPCEPLIPVLMAPAFQHDWALVALVTVIFASVTIVTMVGMALLGSVGLRFAPLKPLEKYAGVMAGAAIFVSGLAIQVLGI